MKMRAVIKNAILYDERLCLFFVFLFGVTLNIYYIIDIFGTPLNFAVSDVLLPVFLLIVGLRFLSRTMP